MRSRSTHKLCLYAALLLSMIGVACRAKEGLPNPPPEVVKLGPLVGKWKSTSHNLAQTLAGQASDTEFTFLCQWTLDKWYVSCTQSGEIAGEKVQEADLFGYSESAKLYTMAVVIAKGDLPPRVYTNWFSWDGDMWRFLPKDGVRSTWEFKSPDLHITRTERSADGVKWTEAASGQHTRVY